MSKNQKSTTIHIEDLEAGCCYLAQNSEYDFLVPELVMVIEDALNSRILKVCRMGQENSDYARNYTFFQKIDVPKDRIAF